MLHCKKKHKNGAVLLHNKFDNEQNLDNILEITLRRFEISSVRRFWIDIEANKYYALPEF